jgi:hypothetical protein
MNQLNRILSLFLLVGVTVFFAACDGGGDNEKSEQEIQIEKLVGTWNATNVTYEGNTNADYSTFQLVIGKSSNSAMTYQANNRPAKLTPWPPSGTFTFGNPVASKLVRDDQVTITYNVSGTNLTMTLENYSGTGYQGRTETVAGNWVFTFTKQ